MQSCYNKNTQKLRTVSKYFTKTHLAYQTEKTSSPNSSKHLNTPAQREFREKSSLEKIAPLLAIIHKRVVGKIIIKNVILYRQ